MENKWEPQSLKSQEERLGNRVESHQKTKKNKEMWDKLKKEIDNAMDKGMIIDIPNEMP